MSRDTEAIIARLVALSGPLLFAASLAIAFGHISELNDFSMVVLPIAVYLVMYLVSLPASVWAWSASESLGVARRRVHRTIAIAVWILVFIPIATMLVKWI